MQKPVNVTSKQIRQALLTLFVASLEGRGGKHNDTPDTIAELAKEFGPSMYHAHLCDCYETDALENSDLHLAVLRDPQFWIADAQMQRL